jgi:S-sulfosulfanyl-L-cysteine sulfohydrolase
MDRLNQFWNTGRHRRKNKIVMSQSNIHHLRHCSCSSCNNEQVAKPVQSSRRDFFKSASLLTAGAFMPPSLANAVSGDSYHANEILTNKAVQQGKAQVFTILHTSDIHAQLYTHDEFFIEKGKPVYKKRGGFAVLKTMLQTLKAQNPNNTILIDGGDCFQGGGVASLSEGRAIVPLVNQIGYDLVLPGNWEVVYGKEMMRKDLGGYNSTKICANMFHDTTDDTKNEMIFPPYWTKMLGGVKIGFIGYNDPLTPKRQSPAYSKGITFAKPEMNVAKYIKILKEYEQCAMVFLVTHMGLAQQVDLANKQEVQGVDYILGADTHERVRTPIQGKFAKVTEPGAFGSFVAKLDIVIEDGKIKDENYQLLDVDPVKYKPDAAMASLVEKVRAPYKEELNKVIGKTKTPLVRYYVIESPIDNLITDALMWKYKDAKVDIVVSNGFRFCPPLVPDKTKGYAEITNDFLWSMLPVESEVKMGEVTGKQLWDWLEKELHNVFAKNPAQRFGGWVVRFQGMKINFTMNNEMGKRINWIKINNEPVQPDKLYIMLACERDGDPDDTLCRMEKVKNPRKPGHTLHNIMREYLAVHPMVAPVIEDRATATDAPSTLLSQLEGYNYQFI